MSTRRRSAAQKRAERLGVAITRRVEPVSLVEVEAPEPVSRPQPAPAPAPEPAQAPSSGPAPASRPDGADRDEAGTEPGPAPGHEPARGGTDGDALAEVVPFPPRPLRRDPDEPAPTARPLVPTHWRRENVGDTLRAYGGRAWYEAQYYGLRAPLVPLMVGRHCPAGVRRLGRGLVSWWLDPRTLELSSAARAAGDHQLAARELDQHNRHVRRRGVAAVPALAGLAGGPAAIGVGLWNPATRLEALAAGFGWVQSLGWFGRPKDRPIIAPATASSTARRKITGDMILAALARAKPGRSGLCPEDDPAVIQAPGVYPAGEGWEAIVDLPPAKTAEDAMDAHGAIASALRVDKSRLEIAPVRGNDSHAGRVSLYIAHTDPWTREPVRSPLAGRRSFSIWDPVPFGTDSRGRLVAEPIIWNAWLFGAMPRQGKTSSARIVAAAGALDPGVEMLVANGKGGKDWEPMRQVAYWYGSGCRDWVVDGLVKILTEWLEDMRRRYDILEALPDAECPDGKVTPQLVAKRPDMRLRMIVIDEVQEYLDDPEHGATLKALLTRIAKLAPATGYMLVLATQKPDSTTLPTSLRDQIPIRFCLKTANSDSTKTVLGKLVEGVPRPEEIPGGREGTGVLLGGIRDAGLVRTHMMNVVELRQVVGRGHELREAAHALTGHAAGENLDEPVPDQFLNHVLAAFAAEEAGTAVWSEVICERLGGNEHTRGDHPDLYDGWSATDLANALLRYGIETRDKAGYLDADGRPVDLTRRERATRKTRKAVRHDDVRRALAARVTPTQPGHQTTDQTGGTTD